MNHRQSQEFFSVAQQIIPGGVNSPVRAFKSVGGNPVYIEHAEGCHLFDVDGNRYIDYVGSWGPLILGHAHPQVMKAVEAALEKGTSYGAPTELEIRMARAIIDAVPSIEMVRMVNSGTEAVMSAIRLARAFTKRDKIVKLEGCYHGHSDGLLARAGSGVTTFGIPDSPGVPAGYAGNTITAQFNDLDGIHKILEVEGQNIACVILEPVAGNMGVIPPRFGFLSGLRELTLKYRVLLIFDEVITGFRLSYGGAQSLYGVEPDLTTLGKIIGGGFPVGAFGGRRDIMELLAPSGPVYQAGTLSGNPIALTAGLATLRILNQPGTYSVLEQKAIRLADGLKEAAKRSGKPVAFNRVGSMMTAFFTDNDVCDYATAKTANTALYATFFQAMLDLGIYLAPSQFEAAFVSLGHTNHDLDETISAARQAFDAMKESDV